MIVGREGRDDEFLESVTWMNLFGREKAYVDVCSRGGDSYEAVGLRVSRGRVGSGQVAVRGESGRKMGRFRLWHVGCETFVGQREADAIGNPGRLSL